MSKYPFHQQSFQSEIMQSKVQKPVDNLTKNHATTNLTKYNAPFIIPKSLVLGKNNLLQNNTASQSSSVDDQSDVSFEERLHFEHEKILIESLKNYFQLIGKFDRNTFINQSITQKSSQILAGIETKCLEHIENKYGNVQFEKIKIVVKFLRRNDNMGKIYFQVMRNLSSQLQTCVFFLFKECLLLYLKGKQKMHVQGIVISENSIEQYVKNNISAVCQSIRNDQKLQLLHYNLADEKVKNQFEELISIWLISFFLSKQGFPSKDIYINRINESRRSRLIKSQEQKQKRKRIKRE